jgi:O-antigen/teichoic acid export membrane protein
MTQAASTLGTLEPPAAWSSRRLMANVLSLSGGEVLARVVAFFGTAWVARKVGPDGFGAIGFAAAVCGYLSIAVSAGFNDVGARQVARNPAQAPMLAAGATAVRLLLAICAFAVLALVVPFLNEPPTVKWVVLLTGLSFFSLALNGGWVLKALERNVLVAISLVAAQIIYVLAVLAAVRRPQDVMLVPVARFAGEMVAAVLLGWGILRLGRPRIHLAAGWRILKGSGFLTLSLLLRSLIFTFDVVVITIVLGTAPAGYYTAAYSLCYLLLAVAVSANVSFLPLLTRAHLQGNAALGEASGRTIELAAAIGAPLIAGGIVLAAPLLHLVFGSGYEQGAGALAVLLLSIGSIFLWGTVHNVLLVCERTGAEMWTIAAAAALNVGLNLVLVKRYGLVGAAWSTVAAEAVILIAGTLLARSDGVRWRWGPIARPLAAALVMAAAVYVVRDRWPLVTAVALGAAVYCVVLLILGVPREVRDILRGTTESPSPAAPEEETR